MQDGLLLCIEKCVDNTVVWSRGKAIQDNLRFPIQEPLDVTALKRKAPNIISQRGWSTSFPETFLDIRALDLKIWRVRVSKDGVLYASVVEDGNPQTWVFDAGPVADWRLKVDITGLLFMESISSTPSAILFSITLVGPDGAFWRVSADTVTGLLVTQKQ